MTSAYGRHNVGRSPSAVGMPTVNLRHADVVLFAGNIPVENFVRLLNHGVSFTQHHHQIDLKEMALLNVKSKL
jgi:hypothetical protein